MGILNFFRQPEGGGRFDIITVGGATEDITLETKEGILIDNKDDVLRQKLLAFEFGAKIKIDRSSAFFGGGAANAAVCASRLGFRTRALVAVGHDERGERIISNLRRHGVDTGLVETKRGSESGFSFLIVGENNEHVVFSSRAANSELNIKKEHLSALAGSKWIYVTSLSGKWKDDLNRIFSVKGVKFAWDPGHIQLNAGFAGLGKYLKRTDVLKVNRDEAIELVVSHKAYKKRGRKFLNDVKNLLKVLKLWVPGIVVVTNGKYGASAFDGREFYHQPILKERKRVDTTGVGDAFGATFVCGLELYRGDIKKAMHLAARNTASVIAIPGAQNGLLIEKDI